MQTYFELSRGLQNLTSINQPRLICHEPPSTALPIGSEIVERCANPATLLALQQTQILGIAPLSSKRDVEVNLASFARIGSSQLVRAGPNRGLRVVDGGWPRTKTRAATESLAPLACRIFFFDRFRLDTTRCRCCGGCSSSAEARTPGSTPRRPCDEPPGRP
jgi:hypothetical protein